MDSFSGPARLRRWTGLGLVALLLLTAGALWLTRVHPAVAQPVCGPVARPAEATPADVEAVIRRQAEALARLNRDCWLAPVAPSLHATFTERYELFSALRVADLWAEVLGSTPGAGPAGRNLRTSLRYRYCTQVDACPRTSRDKFEPTEAYLAEVSWELTGAGLVITGYEERTDPAAHFALPWLTRPTVSLVSGRVTVLAEESQRGRMAQAMRYATEGVARADAYALNGPPRRYVIYLPGPDGWKERFGETIAIAFTQPTSRSSEVIEVNPAYHLHQYPRALLHEMGHVATNLGLDGRGWDPAPLFSAFWIEGLAELVAWGDRDLERYDRFASFRPFVSSGFSGDLDQYLAYDAVGSYDDSNYYALGLMTWRCVFDRYGGRTSVVALARKLFEMTTTTADQATRAILNLPWDDVERTCVDYIRDAVK